MPHRGYSSLDTWVPWSSFGLVGKSAHARLRHSITLASILAGDTCSPLSLKEFEAYLENVEFSSENLRFIVWFQDYRQRFNQLPPEVQTRSPGPSDLSFGPPSSASIARRREHTSRILSAKSQLKRLRPSELAASTNRRQREHDGHIPLQPLTHTSSLAKGPDSPSSRIPPSPLQQQPTYIDSPPTSPTSVTSGSVQPLIRISSIQSEGPLSPLPTSPPSRFFLHHERQESIPEHPSEPSASPPPPGLLSTTGTGTAPVSTYAQIAKVLDADPSNQPFRVECMRVVATFLRPGAKLEISLEDEVRELVLKGLAWNTHPDVFMPAYEAVYHSMETSSVPNFLRVEMSNINIPKQLFWYSVGTTVSLISWTIVIFLIAFVKTPPHARRAYRLFALPFANLGSMQIYSAYRGFCSVVWGRQSRQLKSWELDDPELIEEWDRSPHNPVNIKAAKQKSSSAPDDIEAQQAGPSSSTTTTTIPPNGTTRNGIITPATTASTMKANGGSGGTLVFDEDGVEPLSWGAGLELDGEPYTPVTPETPKSSHPLITPSSSFPRSGPAQHARQQQSQSRKEKNLIAPFATSPVPSLEGEGRDGDERRFSVALDGIDISEGQEQEDANRQRSERGRETASNIRWRLDLEEERRAHVKNRKRPPTFGPEKLIEDPHIIALHKQTTKEILRFGMVWMIIFAAIVLSIPARIR